MVAGHIMAVLGDDDKHSKGDGSLFLPRGGIISMDSVTADSVSCVCVVWNCHEMCACVWVGHTTATVHCYWIAIEWLPSTATTITATQRLLDPHAMITRSLRTSNCQLGKVDCARFVCLCTPRCVSTCTGSFFLPSAHCALFALLFLGIVASFLSFKRCSSALTIIEERRSPLVLAPCCSAAVWCFVLLIFYRCFCAHWKKVQSQTVVEQDN